MQKGFAWLLMGLVLVAGYSYYRNHLSQTKAQVTEQSQEAEAKPEAQGADQTATVVGPLAEWMEKANPLRKAEPPRKPHPSDHIAPSPVGTSSAIVRRTFAVSATAKFPFEIPTHAASPQLHGTYPRLRSRPGFNPAMKARTSTFS